jgi:hypothetical protein
VSTDSAGSYRFLAWSRRGLAAANPTPDPAGGRLRIPVTLTVRKGESDTEEVTRTLHLYGPGDVVGLDRGQVIRREPPPGTGDFEPNYFPLVELDTPELPWLLSPEANGERLRPWLVLVVIRRELARLRADPRRPLPWLRLSPADAADELPDLAESWAWAHAQIAGSGDSPVDALDGRRPELTLARLMAPRRLLPHQTYTACLVPAYLAGVQAGRGEPVTAGAEPAWPPAGGWPALAGTFELPVYDHWEFATAGAGDFEVLVRRLRPYRLGPDIGTVPVDISDPGPDFADLGLPAPALLPFEGALTSLELPQREWPPGVRELFGQRLEDLIEAPPGVDLTVLRPPVYGGLQAGTPQQLPAAGGARPWLRELNLDPGWRAAAALGTRVVQRHQEQFVASAWEQAGELQLANGLLRQAQLARAAATAARDKHLDGLPADAAVRVTEPLHSRVRLAADGTPVGPGVRRTLRVSVKESVFPQAAISPPFRRAARPVGPLGRRLPGPAQQATARLTEGLAGGALRVPVRPARGGADFDDVGASVAGPGADRPRFQHLRANVGQGGGWRKVAAESSGEGGFYVGADPYPPPPPAAPPPAEPSAAEATEPPPAEPPPTALPLPPPGDQWQIDEIGRRADRLRGINNRFKQATTFLLDHLPAAVDAPPPAGPRLGLVPVAEALVRPGRELEPDRTVAREVVGLVPAAPPVPGADPLRPRAATPRFPQPMSEPLRELDGQMLLPGIDRIPADCLGILVGNPRFIEAYMVGLNHELSRELLWRGLPVDLGATFASRFWDVRGRPGLSGDPPSQLPPITAWQEALGGNAPDVGGADMPVLLIRGRLLQRYPHTVVYAARAVPRLDPTGQPVPGPDGRPIPAPGPEERYPLFRGSVDPDVTYLGFDLDVAEARGDGGGLGWFFVIQEQPTAPRFGLDEPGEGPPVPLTTWSDVDWGDAVPSGIDLAAVRYVRVAGPLATPPLTLPVLAGHPEPTATWGADSAQLAAITYQRPMRVAIHARTALPETP